MNIEFTPHAWEEYNEWLASDVSKVIRINELIKEIRRNPFKGTGKPEPLRHDLKGYWSRRIDKENRLVYRVTGAGDQQKVQIVQCKFHY